jgi:alcohol dehydrogenase, propanol-preferring
MQALQLTGWKRAGELVEVDEPEPGPGEVLVRIGGAGACHSDLHLMHDFEPGMMPWSPPFTLGHENAGWVEALGAGVKNLEVGTPVAVYGPWGCGRCRRCAQGMENYCERPDLVGAAAGGLGADGGMAPYMVVPSARHLVPIGDLDPAEAAPLTDAGLTPYHAVKRGLHLLTPGSVAVVIGAGGLGHLAVQMLRALSPAMVIAVDQRHEALALATDVGAHAGVLADDGAAAAITEHSRGRGADLVLDVVGVDATLALGAAITRPLGQLTIVGIGGGSLPVGFFTIGYEVSVATTYWGSLPELDEVLALAQAGMITPHVQRFGLDEAPAAYERLAAGDIDGRAVIVPS